MFYFFEYLEDSCFKNNCIVSTFAFVERHPKLDRYCLWFFSFNFKFTAFSLPNYAIQVRMPCIIIIIIMYPQSEHIGQWATPRHLSDVRSAVLDLGLLSTQWHHHLCIECYTLHDRRLGGIGRVVPIARCSRCSDWFVIAERLS